MGKAKRKRPRHHCSVHLLETMVWNVCRQQWKGRWAREIRFTQLTHHGLIDPAATAAGMKAKGSG
jgi:hypothetical protein